MTTDEEAQRIEAARIGAEWLASGVITGPEYLKAFIRPIVRQGRQHYAPLSPNASGYRRRQNVGSEYEDLGEPFGWRPDG